MHPTGHQRKPRIAEHPTVQATEKVDRTIPMIISESHQSRLSIRGEKYAQSSAVKFKDVKGLQTRDVKYKKHIQVMGKGPEIKHA
jgi:hypothetical protein